MSARNSISVDIVTAYKGKDNVKQAQSDLAKLGGEAKKLAGDIGLGLGTAAIVAFGKETVQAFAADNKSAQILDNTLGNLGQSMAEVPVEKFITNLSELNGVAKTDLRTAFDSLFRATGNTTQAQDLLNLSLNITAGTGKDLATVSTSLAKAYGGNVVALGRLGTGLSKNDLTTKSFYQIQKKLNDLFTGDASTAANSYAGNIARIGTTWEEAKITIGSGLVDALSSVGTSSGLKGFQHGMDTIATDVANTERGLGDILGILPKINKAVGSGTGIHLFADISKIEKYTSVIGILADIGKTKKAKADALKSEVDHLKDVGVAGAAAAYLAAKAQKKIADDKAKQDAAALAAANKLKQAAQDKLKAERDSLALKLAGNTTDMQNIEIQAALQRGQTEQVTNVLLLQRAVIDGNASQAEILAEQVLKANGLVMDVSGNISSLKGAKNPFADWPAPSASALADITKIQDALAALVAKAYVVHVKVVTDSPIPIPGGDPLSGNGTGGDQGGAAHPNGVTSSIPSDWGQQLNYNTNQSNGADRAGGQGTVINLTVTPGSVVTATQDASANGTQLSVNRLNALGN